MYSVGLSWWFSGELRSSADGPSCSNTWGDCFLWGWFMHVSCCLTWCLMAASGLGFPSVCRARTHGHLLLLLFIHLAVPGTEIFIEWINKYIITEFIHPSIHASISPSKLLGNSGWLYTREGGRCWWCPQGSHTSSSASDREAGCLVKRAHCQSLSRDSHSVAELGISTRGDSSVSGYGPSVDHFEKQYERHKSSYSADLEMQSDINRRCAGSGRGSTELWMLMTSQMGHVKWRASGHTEEACVCIPVAFLGIHLPSNSVAGAKPGEASTEQGSTSPCHPFPFPDPSPQRVNWGLTHVKRWSAHFSCFVWL